MPSALRYAHGAKLCAEMNQRQRLGEILMMDKMMDKYFITRNITGLYAELLFPPPHQIQVPDSVTAMNYGMPAH